MLCLRIVSVVFVFQLFQLVSSAFAMLNKDRAYFHSATREARGQLPRSEYLADTATAQALQ